MAELIVVAPLVGVAQDFVGLGGLLELLFGFLVTGILVRVALEGLLAVRLLDLFARGILVDAKHFVIVTFRRHTSGEYTSGCGRQTTKSLARLEPRWRTRGSP